MVVADQTGGGLGRSRRIGAEDGDHRRRDLIGGLRPDRARRYGWRMDLQGRHSAGLRLHAATGLFRGFFFTPPIECCILIFLFLLNFFKICRLARGADTQGSPLMFSP